MWLFIAGNNAFVLLQAYRQHTSTSLTLFIGGVFGAIAVLTLPYDNSWYWCWLPLVLDVGCVPALVRILLSRSS